MKIVLVTSSVTAIPDNYFELFSKLFEKYPSEIKALIIVKNTNWDLLKKILALYFVGAKNLSQSLRNNWVRLLRGEREELCKKRNIPVLKTQSMNDQQIIDWIKNHEIDLVINIRTRCIYKNEILNAPKIACINIHHGILPQYRGVMCDLYALSENRPAGYSIHVMTSKLDAGEILFKQSVSQKDEKNYVNYLGQTGRHEFDGLCTVIDQIKKHGIKGEPNTCEQTIFTKNPNKKIIQDFIKKGMIL